MGYLHLSANCILLIQALKSLQESQENHRLSIFTRWNWQKDVKCWDENLKRISRIDVARTALITVSFTLIIFHHTINKQNGVRYISIFMERHPQRRYFYGAGCLTLIFIIASVSKEKCKISSACWCSCFKILVDLIYDSMSNKFSWLHRFNRLK